MSSSIQFTEGASPDTPATNKVRLFVKTGGSIFIKDDAGLESNLSLGSVFGADFQTAASDVRTTTTSAIFQTKVALTTGAITGTYRVSWTAIIDNASVFGEFRLQNVTDAATVDGTVIISVPNASDRISVGGFGFVVFAGVAKTFEVQFRDQSGGSTQGIDHAHLELWRVS